MISCMHGVTVPTVCQLVPRIIKGRVIVSRCVTVFSRMYTRARERTSGISIFYMQMLPYVYISTVTQCDSMTMLVFVRLARCHVDCHCFTQGDIPEYMKLSRLSEVSKCSL